MEQLHLTPMFTSAAAIEAVDPEIVATFRRVCESQLDAVFSYVRYRVENRDTAEELTSTAFLNGLERLQSFDPARGEMAHWIFGIARHVVTDYLRARRRWNWFRSIGSPKLILAASRLNNLWPIPCCTSSWCWRFGICATETAI